MNEQSVASLTAALRAAHVGSSQREITPNSSMWVVYADAQAGTSYTMAQLANLESAHNVGARTDRAEFGPGTAAQAAGLEAGLKAASVEYRTFEKVEGSGQWFVFATSGGMRTLVQVQALEAAHGLVARTTRAEFR